MEKPSCIGGGGGGGGGPGAMFGMCICGVIIGGSAAMGGNGGTDWSSEGCIEGVIPLSEALLRGGGTAIGGREEVEERRASSAPSMYTSAYLLEDVFRGADGSWRGILAMILSSRMVPLQMRHE